jgi:hypothetical protein
VVRAKRIVIGKRRIVVRAKRIVVGVDSGDRKV